MKVKYLTTQFPFYTFLIPFIFILNELRMMFFYYYKTTLTDKVLFSLIICGLAVLVFTVCKLLTKNNIKAGLLSFIPLLFFIYYFDIFMYIIEFSFIKTIQNQLNSKFHFLLILIVFIITILLFFFLIKTKMNFIKLTLYLNIIFAIFLGIEIYKFANIKPFHMELKNKETIDINTNGKALPDIYYLVFDGYTSNNSLKKFWNYDNSGLKNFLQEKGFWFSDSATSNYNTTELSKISTLNLSYLNVNNTEEYNNIKHVELRKLINDCFLFRFLKSNNYEIINDYTFDYTYMPGAGPKSVENYYYRTIIYLFQEKFFGAKLPDYYKTYDTQISNIINIRRKEKPLFYSMHIMLPHWPHIYDSIGNKLFTDNSKLLYDDDKKKYLEQLKYTNCLIKKIVTSILNKSVSKPIIIIKGDHGFRDLKNNSKYDMLEESFSILNTIYFPDQDYSILYNKMSSVNTFRMVLNTCFGTNFKKLEDRKVDVFESKP